MMRFCKQSGRRETAHTRNGSQQAHLSFQDGICFNAVFDVQFDTVQFFFQQFLLGFTSLQCLFAGLMMSKGMVTTLFHGDQPNNAFSIAEQGPEVLKFQTRWCPGSRFHGQSILGNEFGMHGIGFSWSEIAHRKELDFCCIDHTDLATQGMESMGNRLCVDTRGFYHGMGRISQSLITF